MKAFKIKVAVVAFESSGRKWVDSMLRQHPLIEVLGGYSFPSNQGSDRCYPSIPREADKVVVVVRDRNCQEMSVQNRGYNADTPGRFTPQENLFALIKAIGRREHVWFDYEAALIFKRFYLNHIFAQLGVLPVPVDTDWRDENRKYLGL